MDASDVKQTVNRMKPPSRGAGLFDINEAFYQNFEKVLIISLLRYFFLVGNDQCFRELKIRVDTRTSE